MKKLIILLVFMHACIFYLPLGLGFGAFAQTITTGTVSTPICANAVITVPYTITGTYTAGNIFSAELSDSSGSFATPEAIGTLSSTTEDTIIATIPSSIPTGAGYRIRVVSSIPIVTGIDNGSNISISNCNDSDLCTDDDCLSGSCVYTPNFTVDGAWRERANLPGLVRTYGSFVGFSIGSIGYIGLGGTDGPTYYNDFWAYDPSTNAWTQKANFTGGARTGSFAFSIGSKGYIGTGTIGCCYLDDFWEYGPGTNQWTQKADFGGTARREATGLCIGSKGYVVGGTDGVDKNDFWEYDPANDTWTQKTDYPGGGAGWYIAGFSIGNKGYMGTGLDATASYNDFWEYDPATDAWTAKSDFPGAPRNSAVSFSIGGKGYLGLGSETSVYTDFWEYDPVTDTWTVQATHPGPYTFGYYASFSIGNRGYVSLPANPSDPYNEFWEFIPGITASANSPVPEGGTLNLSTRSATNYSWSGPNGFSSMQQNPSITNVTTAAVGTYSVTVTNSDSCVAISSVTVTVNPLPCLNSVFGLVTLDTLPAVNVEIILYRERLLPGKWDSVETVFTNSIGEFRINDLDSGTYIILARPNIVAAPMAIPTYFGNTSSWQQALQKQYACTQQDSLSIAFLKVPARNGNGTISGYVLTGSNKRAEPIEEEDIIITKVPPGSVAAFATTGFDGYYEVNGLESGNYQVVVEIAGMTMVNNVNLSINDTDTLFENVNFSVDTGSGTIEPLKMVGFNDSESGNSEILFYPNPVHSDIFILLNQFNEKPHVLELFNVTGQKIISLDHPGSDLIQIKRNSLSSGLYLLRLIFSDKVQCGRIIMQ